MERKKHKRSKHLGLEPGTYEYNKSTYLKFAYGIDYYQYLEIYNKQEGKCAICGKHELELPKKLHVDYCHETKRVRGLLCFHCNAGIGHFEDKIERFQKVIEYLN